MATKTATKKQTEIQAPVIHRIVDKLTKHCYGYLVKSDSSDEYYQVTWNRSTHQYQCSCPATTKSCKHIRSVQSVLVAKKQLQAPRRLAAFFQALATVAQQQVAEQVLQEAEKIVSSQEVTPDAEQATKPQRYCSTCQTALPLQPMPSGMMVCKVCTENIPVKWQPAKKAPPTIATRGNAPLATTRTVTLTR